MPPLHLPPVEDLILPSMQHTRISGTNDPGVLLLEFETLQQGHAPQFPGQSARATICVPVKAVDCAGLLRSLLMLRERGLIPLVSEPSSAAKPN
jgi:hypothetical protein